MSISTRFRKTAPPSRPPTSSLKPSKSAEAKESQEAEVLEPSGRRGTKKLLLGLGLATMALSACGGPKAPAPDPGSYQIDSPEVVVMSGSTERIDLAREQETVCHDYGEDETCHTHDVEYHDVGIHLGEGVVQDLNGNLFAAPQLVVEGAPAAAVINPDSVSVDKPLAVDGHLRKTSDGNYVTRGAFGHHEIEVTEKGVTVHNDLLFRTETMSVENVDGVSTIREGRFRQSLVQSQGDHVLVQTPHGRSVAQIRRDDNAGRYEVTHTGFLGSDRSVVEHSDGNLEHDPAGWGHNTTVRRLASGKIENSSGPFSKVTTTPDDTGWTDNYGLGIKEKFEISGGTRVDS